MFVKLQYPPHRPGEFAVNPDRVVLIQPFYYLEGTTEYEGSKLHLDTGEEIECGSDVDTVLEAFEPIGGPAE